MTEQINEELEDALVYKQAYHDFTNDRNHSAFGTRDYVANPIKSFEHYLRIREQQLEIRRLARKQNPLPPEELTWLFTHCRAIGMTCKSESGKWEEDIALFTQLQQERIKELEALLASKK